MLDLKVLFVGENDADAQRVAEALRTGGFSPDCWRVGGHESLPEALRGRSCDIAFCAFSGLGLGVGSAVDSLRKASADLPIILLADEEAEEAASAALAFGANDYLVKNNLLRLIPAVKRAICEGAASRENRSPRKSLIESEERLARTQRIARMANWDYFPNEDRLECSDALFELFGIPREKFGNRAEDFMVAVHPDDRDHVRAKLEEAAQNAGITEFEHRIVRIDDGRVCHIRERSERLLDSSGKPLWLSATAQDITGRKRNEAELKHIKLAVENAADAIVIFDGENHSIFHNRAFIDLLGYTPEQLNDAGGPGTLFAHRGIADEAFAAVAHEGSWNGDAFLRTLSDRTVELFLRANAVRGAQGQTLAVIIVGTDLSGAKRAERKIEEQAALLDQAQDAISVRDLRGCVRYWNKSAERLFGWSAEEVDGRPVQGFLYANSEAYDEGVVGVLREGDFSSESRKLTKSGGEVLVEERARLLRDDFGDPKSILVINTDITERKKLEAQFFRAQRMDSIGTLAGGIAHDLNNVLGPIIMAVDLFKLKLTDPGDLELLETVEVSARRGAEMVKQVLSFARGIEGSHSLVQPARLLKEIQKIASETFPKSISVRTRTEQGIWNIPCDQTQLHQILLNLCVNARDAMPDGGRLTLTAANKMIDAQFASMHSEARPGVYVVFQVADTGAGMAPDVVEKIFDPFFTTKEVGKGTGLGLSTTLALVKGHGGFITVDSVPHRGTTFLVHIPADLSGAKAQDGPIAGELPRGNGETILVIDDEASVRTITKQTLETFGYQVLTAADGADGVATYAQNVARIAVVLTDMMMPVMDGAATIRALMRINPHVQIIAASGLSTKGAEAEAAGSGVRCFLPKPYNAETLLTSLRDLLNACPESA